MEFQGDDYLRIQRNADCDSGHVFYVSPGDFWRIPRWVRFVLLVALLLHLFRRDGLHREQQLLFSGFHVAHCS